MKPFIMMNSTITAGLAGLALSLTACGGGGGGGGSVQPPDPSNPAVVQLNGAFERADSLLLSTYHASGTLTAQGQTVSESVRERFSCSGTRCRGNQGTDITVADLLDPDVRVLLRGVDLGTRGGFNIARVVSALDLTQSFEGARLTSFPSFYSYGVWADHGFATVGLAKGRAAGTYQGVAFSGTVRATVGAALGDTSGSNPAGMGSATWTGIAEAASTNTFERRQGTATLTIPDLSTPRVSADVRIGGASIGSSRWNEMPLSRGSYGAGTAGQDLIRGSFHGPAHQETYGIFDTGAYVGAFGAKRQ